MRNVNWVLLLCVLAAGCKQSEPYPGPSPRVVTLAPHITELVFAMGLGEHIVGVSGYCVLPPGEDRPVVGDIHVNTEAILAQQPDIVFYNQRDEDFAALRSLAPEIELVRAPNRTLAELLDSIDTIGMAMDEPQAAAAVHRGIEMQLAGVRHAVAELDRPGVLLVLGYDSPSVVGPDFTTGQLLEIAGGENVAAEAGLESWSRVGLETIAQLHPDVLVCLVNDESAAVRAREYWAAMQARGLDLADRIEVRSNPRLTIPGPDVGHTARVLAEALHPNAFPEEPSP